MSAEAPRVQTGVEGLDGLFATASIPLLFLGSISLDLGLSDPRMGVLRVAISLAMIGGGAVFAYVPMAGRNLLLSSFALLVWMICQAQALVNGNLQQLDNFSVVVIALLVGELLHHRVTRPANPRYLSSWTRNL